MFRTAAGRVYPTDVKYQVRTCAQAPQAPYTSLRAVVLCLSSLMGWEVVEEAVASVDEYLSEARLRDPANGDAV